MSTAHTHPSTHLDLYHEASAVLGWYSGDFHTHTDHSGGALTPPKLAAHYFRLDLVDQ